MRGDIINGISEQDLNTIFDAPKKSSTEAEWDKYMEYVGTALYGSEDLRKQAISAGYKILDIYPIYHLYHQGWEMDEWGAIGEKDGKKWVLETSHGSLQIPQEPMPGMVRTIMNVLGFK